MKVRVDVSISTPLVQKDEQIQESIIIPDSNFDNETTIQFSKIIQNQDINVGKFLFNYPDGIDVIKN